MRADLIESWIPASPEFTESKLSRRLFRGFSVIFSAPAKLAALRQSLASSEKIIQNPGRRKRFWIQSTQSCF